MSSTPRDPPLSAVNHESEALQRLREELEQERNSRREAQAVLDAVLEATSQDLYQKNEELRGLNADLEARVRERTRDLARATAAAERADAAKSEFLARMSHEIRTPMNGVLGMLDVLRTTIRDPRRAHYAQTAYSCATSLLGIIDDILDFSKIEAGKLELETLDFDLHALARQLILLWTQEAERRGLTLQLAIADDVPREVGGDPTRLMQVLGNLVSNALKFTPRGFVRLRLEKHESPSPDLLVRFTVEDSGIGIARDVQQTLFSAFAQAEASTSRRFGGSGLGLAICRQLLTMMGCDIELESEPGHGSRFFFTLPLAPASRALEARVADRDHANPARRFEVPVLVVDDNDVNREVAGIILEACGCRVSFAADGREALEQLGAAAPSLVLMDCHMPGLDGFECTREIRARERATGTGRLPIIGVSASISPEERARCASSGMDDFLPKPITRAAIGALLQRWLGDAAPAVRESVKAGAPPSTAATAALLDLAHVAEMRAAAGADFAGLVLRFETTSREQIGVMRAALAQNDAQSLKRLAHKLKGSASSLGAAAVARICAHIEQRASAGELPASADLDELEALQPSTCTQLHHAAGAAS